MKKLLTIQFPFPPPGWFYVKTDVNLLQYVGINILFLYRSLYPLPPLPSLATLDYITHMSPLTHSPRLGQPLQPHSPQPVWRVWGPAGPPPAGGAGQDDTHVPVEGRHRAGLAGGCHGDAHVHPRMLRKCQEWKGRIASLTWCRWTHQPVIFQSIFWNHLAFVYKKLKLCGFSCSKLYQATLTFCRFYSGLQMKTWSWV